MSKSPLSKKQAIQMLWRKANLIWKLDKNQQEMYKFVREKEDKIIVIGSSRQVGKCLAEGTLITTLNRGLVPIEDILPGDVVWGYNNDGSLSPTSVKASFSTGMKEVVDLTHRNVVWATASEDHVFVTTDDQGQTWKETKVKDFKYDTKIRRVFVDMPGGEIREPHAYVLGAFLGDGCTAPNKYNKSNKLIMSSEDNQIPFKIAEILGCFVSKQKGKNYNWIFSSLPNTVKWARSTKLSFNNSAGCIDKKAHEKTIDLELIKSWDRESQLNFLAGLIDTDGSVRYYNGELCVGFYSQSKSLVEAVQYLFLYHFQYKSNILVDNRSKYKNGPLYYITITNNLINKRIIKTLTPFLAKEKKKWKPEYEYAKEHNTRENYIGLTPKNKRFVKTYDITVDNQNSLYMLANGLITHNSYFLTTLAVEECLRNPFIIVKFIAPKVKDIRRIIAPLIREITHDCPDDLKPEYKTQENVFRFKNGSEIQLAGTDNGHAESIRGNKANLCIIDEAGFCDDLNYIVNSILIPTTTTTKGKIVMASTPSKSPDHDFMTFMKQAELENRFVKKTIYDNPRLTESDINALAEALGGKDSVDFKREYLVEMIVSEEDAVIPEFTKDLQSRIIKEWQRPPFFEGYVSMDIGGADFTAVLFAYYDFVNAKIVIEDELLLNGKLALTDNIASSIKAKEANLWTSSFTGEVQEPVLRVADNNNIILLNDLNIKHKINFVPTLKDNKDAALNHLRMLLRSERIIIHPRCVNLKYHLEAAIWNKDRTKYARSADKGHFDLVDAAVYLARNINVHKNPYPANYQLTGKEVFVASDNKQETPFESGMRQFMLKRNPFRSR